MKNSRQHLAGGWQIEVYHRGLKQNTGIEWGQLRLLKAQKSYIGLAISAFVRLEIYRLKSGISWFETEQTVIRQTIQTYLLNPIYIIFSTA